MTIDEFALRENSLGKKYWTCITKQKRAKFGEYEMAFLLMKNFILFVSFCNEGIKNIQ